MSFVTMKHVIPLYPLLGSTSTGIRYEIKKSDCLTYVSENEEDLGFVGICNPHFGTVDDPVLAVFLRTRL